MKRPFAVLGGIALISSFLNLYIGLVVSVLFCIASITVLLLKEKRGTFGLLCFILLAVLIVSSLNTWYKQTKIELLAGQRIIEAQIIKLEKEVGYNRITVSTSVGSLRFKAQLFDYIKGNYTEGDRVVFDATLEVPSENIGDYLNSNRIFLNGNVKEIKEINKGANIYKVFYNIKNYIEEELLETVGRETATPLIAIMTGNQNYFDLATDRAIKATGTSHIMVVSGLHLGIICGALTGFLKSLNAKPKTLFLGGLLAIILVLGVCGFHISAIRPAVTYLVVLIGILIKRRADALNSLGFAVYLITALNPLIAGSVSFLLSISATFGVIYLSPKLQHLLTPQKLNGRKGALVRAMLQIASVSISAMLCTTPILIFTFGYVSVISVVVNLLITYAVSLSLILTVLGVMTSFIPFVGKLILNLSGILARYFMWVINLFGLNERFVLYFDLDGKIVFSALAIILILLIVYKDFKKRKEAAEHAY